MRSRLGMFAYYQKRRVGAGPLTLPEGIAYLVIFNLCNALFCGTPQLFFESNVIASCFLFLFTRRFAQGGDNQGLQRRKVYYDTHTRINCATNKHLLTYKDKLNDKLSCLLRSQSRGNMCPASSQVFAGQERSSASITGRCRGVPRMPQSLPPPLSAHSHS